MTRINYGIDPKMLSNKHLLAEWRELIRIPNSVKTGKYNYLNSTSEFKLGSGHVKFFYDKIGYLKNRWDLIVAECLNRGFSISDYSESFNDIPELAMKNAQPSIKDRNILFERLLERDFDYYSKINILNFDII